MITVENYVTGNAGGPTGQTGHAPDRETAGRTEALLADDQPPRRNTHQRSPQAVLRCITLGSNC